MATLAPSDEVLLEYIVRSHIHSTIDSVVGNIGPYNVETFRVAKVYDQVQYIESDEEDIALTTVPDPISGQPKTSVIEIGIPLIDEFDYTDEKNTQLVITYPITFDLQVFTGRIKPGIKYSTSSSLALAIYMKLRRRFKENRDFGYRNVFHELLQQVSAVTADDEETKGQLHTIDWSLTVNITGILV